jgi:hypothetical protein
MPEFDCARTVLEEPKCSLVRLAGTNAISRFKHFSGRVKLKKQRFESGPFNLNTSSVALCKVLHSA